MPPPGESHRVQRHGGTGKCIPASTSRKPDALFGRGGDTDPVNGPRDDELAALVQSAREAARAYVSGDVDLYLDLVHHARGFTLLPPFGGPVSAHDDRRAELRSWDGTGITGGDAELDHVETHAWGDTVVLVMIERQHGQPAGLPARDLSVRVTHVYRRLGDEWQLVHRHADPLVRPRSPQEMGDLFD